MPGIQLEIQNVRMARGRINQPAAGKVLDTHPVDALLLVHGEPGCWVFRWTAVEAVAVTRLQDPPRPDAGRALKLVIADAGVESKDDEPGLANKAAEVSHPRVGVLV
jgi:hypothetical protein